MEKENLEPAVNWMLDRILNGTSGGWDEKGKLLPRLPHADGPIIVLDKRDNWSKERYIECDSQKTRDTLIALAKGYKEFQDKYYNLNRKTEHERLLAKIEKLEPLAVSYTDNEIDGLIDEWEHDTGGLSVNFIRFPAAEELTAVYKNRLIPFLLRRLRDKSISMKYQDFLRRLTAEDIGTWQTITPQMRAYDVQSSADLWVEWGVAKGLIDKNKIPCEDETLCYKCRKHKLEFVFNGDWPEKDGEVRTIEAKCEDCGVLVLTTDTMENGKLKRNCERLWRPKEIRDIFKQFKDEED